MPKLLDLQVKEFLFSKFLLGDDTPPIEVEYLHLPTKLLTFESMFVIQLMS